MTGPWVLVLGRTLVEGEKDLPAVHDLQDQYRLTPWASSATKGLPYRSAETCSNLSTPRGTRSGCGRR